MKIQELQVLGDSELIIQQVRNQYQTKNFRLKQYRNEVWDLIDNFFLAFNISYVPRVENELVDSLVVSASGFKLPLIPQISFEIQVKYRASIPDNIKNWEVFNDDDEIERFMQLVDEFSAMEIDNDNQDEKTENQSQSSLLKEIAGHKVLELKTNYIPKGLVPLERLFDNNDVVKISKKEQEQETVDCNIGTAASPKIIKLSKHLSAEQRDRYVALMKEYVDTFAWSYEDLKEFDSSIIQHKIPLKEGVQPFKQKLRQINSALFPVIEKELKKLLDAKIIVPLRYSEWVANLVPVRKKNGEI